MPTKVKNPILIFDIVITVILAIVMGVGIGLAVRDRKADEPSTQSYVEYVDMSGDGVRLIARGR